MSDVLTEKIIGAAIEVHRLLGPGLVENIYEEALCIELQLRGIPFQRQVDLEVEYKSAVIAGQKLSLLIEDEVIIEIKSSTRLSHVTTAQIVSQLRVAGLSRALLINFGMARLIDGIKRVAV